MNDNRSEITIDDYIVAYRTYYKLLKTDVSQYRVKKEILNELNLELPNWHDGGYIICDKCDGYYKLEPGESPDDFTACQCGGELEYRDKL